MANIFQLFYSNKLILCETARFQKEICIDFVRWGVASESVLWIREVSAIRRSQCTLYMYSELLRMIRDCGLCPYCGDFRNRESPLLEIPLYYYTCAL